MEQNVTQIIIIPHLTATPAITLEQIIGDVKAMIGIINMIPNELSASYPTIIIDYILDQEKQQKIAKHVINNGFACVFDEKPLHKIHINTTLMLKSNE